MVATRGQQKSAKSNSNGAKHDDELKQTPSEDTEETEETEETKSERDDGETSEGHKGGSEGLLTRLNRSLDDFLFTQVDIAPLVYYRIIFGAIMLWEVTRYLGSEKVSRYYIDPVFYFKYFGFNWMPGPLPDFQMYLFYMGMGMLYVLFMLGLWYRQVSILCFLGFFYWFNLDMSQHLNHFYLVSLMSFLNMFIPAHRNASLDVIRKPEIRVSTVPAWTLWLPLLQISIAYFYGGIAKINSDWLQGEPMRSWLIKYAPEFPSIGHLFLTWWAPYFFAWNGMLYDLIVVPALMWKPTRVFMTLCTIFFHMMNDNMFTIGIFPWFMLFSTPLYFEPELLRPVLNIEWLFAKPVKTEASLTDSPSRRPLIKWFFVTYISWQCLLPFRHHLYPGNSGWTEEGHLYSWHMKLRSKTAKVDFTVKLPDGKEIEVDQKKYLTIRQRSRMPKRPTAIMRFAHFLCDGYNEKGYGPVEVYAKARATMNGRRWQDLIDPQQDMCKATMHLWRTTPWIVPLKYELWDQTMDSLRDRVEARLELGKGADYVGTPAVEKADGGEYRFGTITEYSEMLGLWHVKFDDGKETDFTKEQLAKSHRYHARHVHGGLAANDTGGEDKDASDSEL